MNERPVYVIPNETDSDPAPSGGTERPPFGLDPLSESPVDSAINSRTDPSFAPARHAAPAAPTVSIREPSDFVAPDGLPFTERMKLKGLELSSPSRTLTKYVLVLDGVDGSAALLEKYLREHAMSTAGVNIQRGSGGNLRDEALEALWTFGPTFVTSRAARRLGSRAKSKVVNQWCGLTRRAHTVADVARKYGVKADAFADVNSAGFLETLRERGVELLVCIGSGQVFDVALREASPFGAINLHGSLLPHYKGLNPTFWSAADGQRRSGVCVHYATEELNDGPVLAERDYTVHAHDTLRDIVLRSRELGADALLEAVRKIEFGPLTLAPNQGASTESYGAPRRRDVRRLRRTRRRLG